MGLLALVALPVIVISARISLAVLINRLCPYPSKKRICLLIAHCDDEAMFFSPTVIRLAAPALQNHVEILCLSNGEDPALRSTRSDELLRSAANLGLKSPQDVTCLDDEDSYPDSMTTYWSSDKVTEALSVKYASGTSPSLDIIITFDHKGISSHANHISLLAGARHYIQSSSTSNQANVALYSLITTNIVRKYLAIFDVPLSLILYLLHRAPTAPYSSLPDRMLFFSNFSGYRKAQRSMTNCHKSQMLWFRYGWIFLSRYISTNDLVRQHV
ncbi:putative deacetylase LmbE-like domain-containing protein [Elsinoe ampelina]|uniref:N-acetylglucosaminylphosphatidylinositol deacetylase n=1 Tax=Elsinoe ampelina TaxID=302913 RepID=A0A6A6FYV7_9PEZI|nr:putative deacetylase LmbE-like domain-containing protein [Elsinoe ampelina]